MSDQESEKHSEDSKSLSHNEEEAEDQEEHSDAEEEENKPANKSKVSFIEPSANSQDEKDLNESDHLK